MKHRNLILGVVLIAVLIVGGMAFARSGYLSTFNSMYGTANTALDMCETCHGSSKSIRNAYGLDMEDQLNAGKTDDQALAAIENLDSDGDGYSNIDEITALTLPGDASSYPSGPTCTDADNDGYFAETGCGTAVDCNDNDNAVNPGAAESCTNGTDDDCDGLVDAADPDAVGCPTCTDADTDGYYLESGCGTAVDCNDLDIAVNPGAIEDCFNGIDDDCDGYVDGNDTDCGACVPTAGNEKGPRCKDGLDNDCDGAADSLDPDCGGGDTGGDKEVCDDGIDNDGDGKVDCADKKDCGKDPVCK